MNIWGEAATEDDCRLIGKQLNRKSVDPYGIIRRCSWGFPVAICQKIRPNGILHYGNLANPIWLTCPYLNDTIHGVENDGMIASINDFILNDRQAMESMQDAHAHFYYYRKHLYGNQCNESYSDSLIDNFNVGIGGIADTRFIKCLHLHFAHYMICDKNCVGYMIEQLLNKKINCKDGRCICLKD
ncbi:MAG: DUF501 domain-containing protein [Spirochaetes bacterium]|nr:DUF501 domain-containing protein [Spirochaetota bacterium]